MSYFEDEHHFWSQKETVPSPDFKQMQALKKYAYMKTQRPMNDFEKEALRCILEWENSIW